MSDETPAQQQTQEAPVREFKRLLNSIPPRGQAHAEVIENDEHGIAAAAARAANHRSEARRDAVLAVALAIKRRGQSPLTDWTTKDTDTAYAIADQLSALE